MGQRGAEHDHLVHSCSLHTRERGFDIQVGGNCPLDERVQLLGPAEAPLAVIKGRYRFRLLLKSARGFDLSDYLRHWLTTAPKPKGNLKLEVDVDPQSFL